MRFPDGGTEPELAQHETAAGQRLSGFEPGAGVKDLARQAGGALQTLDDVALSHLVRVAGRGQNYAERRARIPLRIDGIERTAERRLAQQREIGLEAHEDRVRFRIAEAAIELQN